MRVHPPASYLYAEEGTVRVRVRASGTPAAMSVIQRAIRSVELDRAYASLPRLDCQRKCQAACGPIVFSGEERWRIMRRIGAWPQRQFPESLTCPFLDLLTGDCSVHDIRPMICRLWGLTKSMACPFGCVPE